MLKLYRILLHLYPAAFREEYAKAMEQEFRDELAEAQMGFGVVWLWMRLLFDLAISLPVQLAIEMGRDSRHALRLWAKRPWHTGFAVVALGRRHWREYGSLQRRERAIVAILAFPGSRLNWRH